MIHLESARCRICSCRKRWGEQGGQNRETYASQMHVDGATGFNGGGFAAQGGDFAEDTDGLVGEGLEVFGVYAGGGFGGHGDSGNEG